MKRLNKIASPVNAKTTSRWGVAHIAVIVAIIPAMIALLTFINFKVRKGIKLETASARSLTIENCLDSLKLMHYVRIKNEGDVIANIHSAYIRITARGVQNCSMDFCVTASKLEGQLVPFTALYIEKEEKGYFEFSELIDDNFINKLRPGIYDCALYLVIKDRGKADTTIVEKSVFFLDERAIKFLKNPQQLNQRKRNKLSPSLLTITLNKSV